MEGASGIWKDCAQHRRQESGDSEKMGHVINILRNEQSDMVESCQAGDCSKKNLYINALITFMT